MMLCLMLIDILIRMAVVVLFFFKQKTAYEMRISDWSSDVCSSDLIPPEEPLAQAREQPMWEVLPVEPRSPHEVMLVHGTDTDDGSGGPTATRHLGKLLHGVILQRSTG